MKTLCRIPRPRASTPITRTWAMPSPDTFSIAPIASLLDHWLHGAETIIDPFARNSHRGTITNDLSPDTTAQHHMLAENFTGMLVKDGVEADAVLIDPPYSPRQITEVYQAIGLDAGQAETQNGRILRMVKDDAATMIKPGGIAICFGWNSNGLGVNRGFELIEVLLVAHGGAHNDTIVTVEKKSEVA